MINSDGIITEPISVSDPYYAMGVGMYNGQFDLGYIGNHPLTNIWSKWKPVYNTNPAAYINTEEFSYGFRGEDNSFGLASQQITHTIFNDKLSVEVLADKLNTYIEANKWKKQVYLPWYRLTDFKGYNHKAKIPIEVSNSPSNYREIRIIENDHYNNVIINFNFIKNNDASFLNFQEIFGFNPYVYAICWHNLSRYDYGYKPSMGEAYIKRLDANSQSVEISLLNLNCLFNVDSGIGINVAFFCGILKEKYNNGAITNDGLIDVNYAYPIILLPNTGECNNWQKFSIRNMIINQYITIKLLGTGNKGYSHSTFGGTKDLAINDSITIVKQKGIIITLKAVSYSGYIFSKWTDGNTSNPRNIDTNVIVNNKSYQPVFIPSSVIKWRFIMKSVTSLAVQFQVIPNVNVLVAGQIIYEIGSYIVSTTVQANSTQSQIISIPNDGIINIETSYITSYSTGTNPGNSNAGVFEIQDYRLHNESENWD